MGRIISVVNQKGGVGKTTTVINLAAGLAKMNKSILVCDLDSQGNATTGLGIKKKVIKKSSYDLILKNIDPNEVILSTEFYGISIIPSGANLVGIEIDLSKENNRLNLLKFALSKVKDKFDFILLDCPPSLGLVTLNALTASDSIIIPLVAEFYALEGLSQFLNTFNAIKKKSNPDLEILGILFTMYDGRTNLSKQVVREVEKYFPNKVFKTKIPRNVKIAEAPSYGKPILFYDKRSVGTEMYNKLAKEILGVKSTIPAIFSKKFKNK